MGSRAISVGQDIIAHKAPALPRLVQGGQSTTKRSKQLHLLVCHALPVNIVPIWQLLDQAEIVLLDTTVLRELQPASQPTLNVPRGHTVLKALVIRLLVQPEHTPTRHNQVHVLNVQLDIIVQMESILSFVLRDIIARQALA